MTTIWPGLKCLRMRLRHGSHSVADPQGRPVDPDEGTVHDRYGTARRTAPARGRFGQIRATSACRIGRDLEMTCHLVLPSLPADATAAALSAPVAHREVVSGRVPVEVSAAGRVHVFRPDDGGEDHVVCEIGRPVTRDVPFWCGCIRPVSPATFWGR